MEKIIDENILLKCSENKHADQELLLFERISNRDESALSELYDRYSKLLYSLILKIVKSREEAEDLLQSVFIKIWNNSDSFNPAKGSVYSWITALTRNCAIDMIRSKHYKNNRNRLNDFEEIEILNSNKTILSGFDSVIMHERAEFVNGALKRIPSELNTIIKLAYFEGFTQAEIAEELNIPLGTVKTRMRQTLIKLEKILSPVI